MYQKVVELTVSQRPFAAALVLQAEGSTPVGAGARAVIEGDGRIWGTIGGGAVEAEAQRRAVEAIQSHQPVVFDFMLEGATVSDASPICGGRMRVLIDPAASEDRDEYAKAAEALAHGGRGVLITAVNFSPLMIKTNWMADTSFHPADSDPKYEVIQTVLAREEPRLLALDAAQSGLLFIEPVIPQPRLLIVGGGHIGQALALQASLVGFDITVLDDRPVFTDPAWFPEGAHMLCGDIAKEAAAFPVAADTYIVIVTRGHQYDAEALAACIRRPAAYIGMIGSRRKVAAMRREFIESGRATAEEFDRVFAPVGLDIGAVTVPEIAASIVAQLIAVRRKASTATAAALSRQSAR
ncbi:MAG: XdhC/CoxI family protein [Candidatus Sumerlaeia bacterium]|nr:XdhC/CoxI family protein [Candidatus Sumerlaeia bacterium]